jgi:hypothetical protein
MTADLIQPWLLRQNARHQAACWFGAVLALLGGLVVLFLTFWLACAILFVAGWGIGAITELVFSRKFVLTHGWRLALSGLFLLALFIEWIRRRPEDLGTYGEVNAPPGSNALVFHTGTTGALAMLLANPQASATMITEFLYTGPRLILGVGTLLRAATQTRDFDVAGCALALELLASRDKAVAHDELTAVCPEADWPKLHRDLSGIPGVLLLEKSVTLRAELREELAALCAT